MGHKVEEVTISQLVNCKREAEEAIGEVVRGEMKKFESRTGVSFKVVDLEIKTLSSFDRSGLESCLIGCKVEVAL